MAYVDYYGDGGSNADAPYDPGPMGGPVNYTDPPPRSVDPASDPYTTVAGFYQSLLGRQPESNAAAMGWWNGMGGNVNNIYQGIYGSDEAKARRAQPAAPAAPTSAAPAGGGSDQERINAMLQKYGSTDDPNYWYGIAAQHGGLDATGVGWMEDRIMRGDGSALVRSGQVQKFQDGGPAPNAYAATGGNPGGYTDASSQLYLSQLLERLSQVRQPQDNSIFELLKSLATAQATTLQQAPYSAADEQALITKYREPLTQARDAAYQRNKEQASRSGYLPSSGLLRTLDSNVDKAYVGGVAQGANQMGVNAVQLKNQNAMQALQILSSLMSAQNQVTDRGNAMKNQAVDLAKMFPDFDAARLDQLLRASGDSGGGQALSSLMSLGNLNAGIINTNGLNDQANSAAWGKLIAGLLGSL